MINKNKLIDHIVNVDRRVVYLVILLAVTLPFFLKPVIKITPTEYVRTTFNLVEEAAKLNKPIIIGFDYDPSTLAELQPQAEAIMRHAFSRNVKILGLNFIANGTSLAATTMDRIAAEYNKEYGRDYVFMPYMPQYDLVLINLGSDLRKSYKKDFRGIAIEDLPMLSNIRNYDDFHLVVDLTGTKLSQAFIMYGVTRYGFNYACGLTAVSSAEHYPYLQSGQMKGLLTGMKGAAEYEFLSGNIADGMRGMASQSWGHLAIFLFILVGNILYYVKKKMKLEN